MEGIGKNEVALGILLLVGLGLILTTNNIGTEIHYLEMNGFATTKTVIDIYGNELRYTHTSGLEPERNIEFTATLSNEEVHEIIRMADQEGFFSAQGDPENTYYYNLTDQDDATLSIKVLGKEHALDSMEIKTTSTDVSRVIYKIKDIADNHEP